MTREQKIAQIISEHFDSDYDVTTVGLEAALRKAMDWQCEQDAALVRALPMYGYHPNDIADKIMEHPR